MPAELLAGAHHGELVDGDKVLDFLVGDVEKGRRGVHAGAVDQDVDPSMRGNTRSTRLRSSARCATSQGSNVSSPVPGWSASSAASALAPIASPTITVRAPAWLSVWPPAAQHARAADDDRDPPV